MRVYQVSYEITQPGGTHKCDLFCVASSIEIVWEQYREYPEKNEFMSARLIFIGEHVPLDVWLPQAVEDD